MFSFFKKVCSFCPIGWETSGIICEIPPPPLPPPPAPPKPSSTTLFQLPMRDSSGLSVSWELSTAKESSATLPTHYHLQLSDSRDFTNTSGVTRYLLDMRNISADTTSINATRLPFPLWETVVFVRARSVSVIVNADPDKWHGTLYSEWSNPSYTWRVGNDCDGKSYLNDTDKDPLRWKCLPCPRGASCSTPMPWSGVKAIFGNYRVGKKFVSVCCFYLCFIRVYQKETLTCLIFIFSSNRKNVCTLGAVSEHQTLR